MLLVVLGIKVGQELRTSGPHILTASGPHSVHLRDVG